MPPTNSATRLRLKKKVIRDYQFYKNKPKASARAYLYRELLDYLTNFERRIYDYLVDRDGEWLTSLDIAKALGTQNNYTTVYLNRMVEYGVVERESLGEKIDKNRYIYKRTDYLTEAKDD